MGKKPQRYSWPDVSRLCRLNRDEIEMARNLGFGPDTLIRARPGPKERWKLPVKEWVCELYAAKEKPVRIAARGQVWILHVNIYDSFGEDAFRVRLEPAPALDASVAPGFTKKRGQYLAFIYNYTKMHRQAPAESDLQRYFQTTPPTIHDMIKMLELRGYIKRTPGQARSIRLLVNRSTCRDWNRAGCRGVIQELR